MPSEILVVILFVGGLFYLWRKHGNLVQTNQDTGSKLKFLVSKPFVSAYGVLALAFLLWLVGSKSYDLWIGKEGKNLYLLASIVGVLIGVALMNKEGFVPKGLGLLILLIGLSPLIESTRPGQVIARTYGETMDMVQYGRHSKALKLGEWTRVLSPEDPEIPRVFRPEKGYLVVRNTRATESIEYWAYSPEGDTRTEIAFDGRVIPIENDVSRKMFHIVDIGPYNVSSPDRVYYRYKK